MSRLGTRISAERRKNIAAGMPQSLRCSPETNGRSVGSYGNVTFIQVGTLSPFVEPCQITKVRTNKKDLHVWREHVILDPGQLHLDNCRLVAEFSYY